MSNQPKTFFNPKRILLFVAVLFVVCISAFVIVFKWYSPDLLPGGNATSVPITVAGADNTRKPLGDSGGTSQGKAYQMKIALSEGQAAPQAYQPLPVVTGEPLSPAELEQLLARLPALPTAIADQSVFNRPAESLPAPRPGVTIPQFSSSGSQPHSGSIRSRTAERPALCARRGCAGCTICQYHLRPAHGTAWHPGRPGRPGRSRAHRTSLAGYLALAGHQNTHLSGRFRPD